MKRRAESTPTRVYLAALCCMAAATLLFTITLASQDYRLVLVLGLLFALAADILLAIVIVRGSPRWRLAAVLLALPTVWIFAEFIRRAPGSF